MKNGKQRYVLIALTVAILSFILWDSLSQPGVKDLRGRLTQVAFYRNEQNTGPIVRIYAVTVTDTLWNEMKQFGDYMPYNKYGNTKVYFFLSNRPFPVSVFPSEGNFDQQYRGNCIAKYEKDAMSQTSLVKNPFLKSGANLTN